MSMIQVERVLDALGDPTRRAVFRRLRKGDRSVQEIADGMDVSRPAVSQHLKVLQIAGLATVRVEGTRRLYGVDTHGLEALRGWLSQFWDEALLAFKEVAESEAASERSGRTNAKPQQTAAGRKTRSRKISATVHGAADHGRKF